jgi:3-oxoacyl-[acyl-carrier-protein] synthase II
LAADLLGHVHAQGLSTVTGDREEAAALGDVLGDAAARIPTVAAKGNFGNLGAGSGLVECVASILSLGRGTLFPLLNYQASDAACPVRAARRGDAAGDSFVSVAATPQGQAGAVVFRRWPSGPAAA